MWTDRQIVLACLERYPAPYRVTGWPEDSNRKAPEIDAYAEAPGVPALAIEVTKIESFADQRFDDRRIEELGALEARLRPIFPEGVDVLLPTHAIKPGLDWKDVERKLESYLTDLAGRLDPGGSWHSLPGIPFKAFISYEPDLRTPFAFGRIAPAKDTRKDALLASMERALRHKAARLQEYCEAGARGVLILESHDIALISHVDVYTAFLKGRQRVDTGHLDDVWLCFTYNPHRLDEWYCFLGPQNVLDRVNLPNLRLGPSYDSYWEEAIREGRI